MILECEQVRTDLSRKVTGQGGGADLMEAPSAYTTDLSTSSVFSAHQLKVSTGHRHSSLHCGTDDRQGTIETGKLHIEERPIIKLIVFVVMKD